MPKKVLILLAEGFEEMEAGASIDILRRAGVEASTCAVTDSLEVAGSHDIVFKADFPPSHLKSQALDDYDALLLPGGPGVSKLHKNDEVLQLIRNFYERKKIVAAICAAPSLLALAGVAKGHKITAYPGFEEYFEDFSLERVVKSGNIITSRGPATAVEFALSVAEELVGQAKAEEVSKAVLFN